MTMPWKQVQIATLPAPGALCGAPYPGHPFGCPNYRKKSTCPPQAKRVEALLDLRLPVYVVWNAFDFGAHCQRMRTLHPGWSKRQVECCLYWQAGARNHLRAEIKRAIASVSPVLPMVVLETPEANGVNVTETMFRAGIRLEWPPVTVAYQVAVVGFEKKRG